MHDILINVSSFEKKIYSSRLCVFINNSGSKKILIRFLKNLIA